MQTLRVKYLTVTDAVGRKHTGWIVIEDGRLGYPFPTKEQAIKHAEGLKAIRVAPHVVIQTDSL